MDWAKQIIVAYDSIMSNLPSAGTLRFGRSMVSVSDVAKQYYCEKALELGYKYPTAPTEVMVKGKAGHEKVTELATPVSHEQCIRDALKMKKEAIAIYEFGVAWKHNGIPIIGRVDEAWFKGGNVELVGERKFTNRLAIYSDYHIQAQLYCLGLGRMGFGLQEAQYSITVFLRSCHDCPQLALQMCPVFNGKTQSYKCDVGECITRKYSFSDAETTNELDWALDYWIGRREAIPTRKRNKCLACRYAEVCESSLC